jgi:hypothetical protein
MAIYLRKNIEYIEAPFKKFVSSELLTNKKHFLSKYKFNPTISFEKYSEKIPTMEAYMVAEMIDVLVFNIELE